MKSSLDEVFSEARIASEKTAASSSRAADSLVEAVTRFTPAYAAWRTGAGRIMVEDLVSVSGTLLAVAAATRRDQKNK